MHTIFRQFFVVIVMVLLGLTAAPPTQAQTMQMQFPPDFGPLAPPCKTDPSGAFCGSGLNLPATPIDDAIKLIEDEIKRLEAAREAAQKCLEGGGDATCEPFDIPSGADCPPGSPSADCIDPPAPSLTNVQTLDEAIKFIEGLLQDPEPDTPPPGFPVFSPDGKPVGDAGGMTEEAIETMRKDQSCAAIAKLQAQKEQAEFELAKTRSEIFEIQKAHVAERAIIETTEKNFEETFRDLQQQLETVKRLQQEFYQSTSRNQSQISFITQSYDRIRDLKTALSRMTASRERIQISGAERLANSYKNYLDRVVPKWNIRSRLTRKLEAITAQLAQLNASCE